MSKDQIYDLWAPPASPWSKWVKPVLFAWLDTPDDTPPPAPPVLDLNWAPPPGERQALVLDLPGDEGVWVGAGLAARGYRPVPLYNAVPLPYGVPERDNLTGLPIAVVNVMPIVRALLVSTSKLAQADLPPEAPPAFLLDAQRQGHSTPPRPEQFDNRSISFTTDFPSANFLVAQRIEGALLIQRDRLEPQADLAHTLRRWQDGGLQLSRRQLDRAEPAERFHVARPRWYRAMFQRALAGLGFHRTERGAFGAWVMRSSAGG